ncbi:MAG: PBP1A family penicillin-binding protein [Acidobacteria bacterium]|nr:PBP1A family penicillin-binding protein [Acidobacteriota bacterium]
MDRRVKELSRSLVQFLRQWRLVSLFLLTAIAGGLTGWVIAFTLDRSDFALMVAKLSDYQASLLSRVYADDGTTVIGEFYLERRIPVEYRDIPLAVRNAFIAIEDARFYMHYGFDPVRVLGAFWDNLREGHIVGGGSTITQQLARGLFLSREQTYSRKLKEMLLALLIERYYTKDQILELYYNQIYLGGNAYGVEAAAQYYFGKSVKELTLDEAALLGALPKAPLNYSPIYYPEAAKQRRNLVLHAMAEQGFIRQEEAARAKTQPINLGRGERINNVHSPYAYLVEMVRQEMEHKYGTRRTHTGGLQIYTTLNARAQQAALRAVRQGLHVYDRRHGWRDKLENMLSEGKSLESYYHPDWDTAFRVGEYITGLVMNVSDREALVRFGSYAARVTPSDVPWGRPLKKLVRPGDLTVFRINRIDEQNKELQVTLWQVPAVQGALLALEVPSGEIKALVGGYDFNTSRFNHATQGQRQTGSAFKPFIYAAAVEYGLTPDDPVLDDPLQIGDWQPENYDRTYMGLIPIRTALALSRNVPAVRVLQEIGIQRAARLVERLGLPNPMAPYLSSALGATEEPLIDMVKAYAVFANVGKRVYPHFIRRVLDRDGVELERWQEPEPEEVLSPYVASTVVQLMEGVVNSGTAAAIRGHGEFSGWDMGGKTGTVNDFTDAWFIGYTPTVCTGVWIGFDEKKSLGNKESGAVAALPIWINFMKEHQKGQRPRRFELVTTPPPMMASLQQQRRLERGGGWVEGSEGQLLPIVGGPPNLDVLPGDVAPAEDSSGGNGRQETVVPLPVLPETLPKAPLPTPDQRQRRPRRTEP